MDNGNNELEKEAGLALGKEFSGSTSVSWNNTSNFEDLKAALSKAVSQLLQTQPEKLFQILYRLDVNEAYVKAAFQSNAGESLCMELAEKIIERQIQRIKIRKMYSDKSSEH